MNRWLIKTLKIFFVLFAIFFIYLLPHNVNFWQINHSALKKPTQDDAVSVLLLSYSRSGSSLLGELLSLPGPTSYYFEPLMPMKLNCTSQADNSERREVLHIVSGLFSCSPDVVKHISPFSSKKNGRQCNTTRPIVIKTIRLRRTTAEKLLQRFPKLKVVHLIRDPRTQIASRKKTGYFDCDKITTDYCRKLMDDLQLEKSTDSDRYRRIRYEDLVADPLIEMLNLYHFLGFEFTHQIRSQIYDHFHADSTNKNVKNFYGTYRSSGFNKTDLSKVPAGIQKLVQQNCKEFLDTVGYN